MLCRCSPLRLGDGKVSQVHSLSPALCDQMAMALRWSVELLPHLMALPHSLNQLVQNLEV